ncbi:Cupin-like domain 8 [Dillenia turbinata]|uniref:Cupin-like domain 8 n=1 Tax=Dillenia turbinata TaxID=194707 RepID=A0AAN8VVD9_9MAGN
MEENLRVDRFEQLPSALEFGSEIEPRNVPAVFEGCIIDWKAFTKWNPRSGGLNHLQEEVGSSVVEVMRSRSAPVFYGDIRSHERIPLPFSAFVELCKRRLQGLVDTVGGCLESYDHGSPTSEIEQCFSGEVSPQIYLAQVPIMNAENEGSIQLVRLREDIQVPQILEPKALASINLWMNNAQSRSSTHYDPYHNLLCVVAGCKEVVLWPPSASPLLYPKPIYGEASNHSSVALKVPDFSIHPRASRLGEISQKVVLHAGDALFIPEGWFHQVNSDDLTIAVNFWWRSDVISNMPEHMDAYYLRRILRRTKYCIKVLQYLFVDVVYMAEDKSYDLELKFVNKDFENTEQNQMTMLNQLKPQALQGLYELISVVHERINRSDQNKSVQTTSTNHPISKEDCKNAAVADLYHLQDDPVARIIWGFEPLILCDVLLAMVHKFPRTLEALIIHSLSPVGAEVLTRRFDEMDKQLTEDDRNEFYQLFYGVFDDQFAAMDAILNGKESFASQGWLNLCRVASLEVRQTDRALRNVLDQYLGINLDWCKSMVG